MRHSFAFFMIVGSSSALFLICYAPALFRDRQFVYRDAGDYYYPLNERVQAEWNQGRWPLWEPEENAGMPLLGNPTAAVLYPGKLIFAIMPYAWGARIYIVVHSALAFLNMLILMRSWGTSWFGSALSALSYAFGAPVLFQYCNVIFLIGAAWLPLGLHAVDQWVRLGRRWGVLELAIVLSMQTLGGDPQGAYLLGLAGIGYALGLSWSRTRANNERPPGKKTSLSRKILSVAAMAIAVVVWCAVTLELAQWLPKLREPGSPPPPLRWMIWMPFFVTVVWGLVAVGFLVYWRRRAWRLPLGTMGLGLGGSAILAVALTAAQLFPVVEFIQQTRRTGSSLRDTYQFSLEPFRAIELAWPNILGTPFQGPNYWGDALRTLGRHPQEWMPSLYLGGLTIALAVSTLAICRGPSWRVWSTAIVWIGLLGSFGEYASPIWWARSLAATSDLAMIGNWLPDLGPIDPIITPVIRSDGHLHDGDGGFYWWLATVIPGFRYFRYPSKLFTFTAIGIAALAGLGWDQLCTGPARRTTVVFFVLFLVTVAALAGVVFQREPILATLRALKSPTLFGPFEAAAGYRAIIRGLGQAAIVFGLGLWLTRLAKRTPNLAGSAALILMTSDLAAANSRYVLTVPQSVLDARPKVLEVIDQAERENPSAGPFRVHRMPIWHRSSWGRTSSPDRITEIMSWMRDTLQPKHGINLGVNFTHTLGVAELGDYERFFKSFSWPLHDRAFAQTLGVKVGEEVIYFPRRAFDIWNTRYFIVPFDASGWREVRRASASFLFESEQIYPDPARFIGPRGMEEGINWIDSQDFRVIRNLTVYPRSWVVHGVRVTNPVAGASGGSGSDPLLEMLYAKDLIWNDPTMRAFDAHSLGWVSAADYPQLRPFLSGKTSSPSERVKVTYPDPRQAILEVSLLSPGLVILADVYYPGWELAIDGKPAPIYRVNGSMRGAVVASGTHRLVYTFSPQTWRIGRLVSIGGLAALFLVGIGCVLRPVDPFLTGTRS